MEHVGLDLHAQRGIPEDSGWGHKSAHRGTGPPFVREARGLPQPLPASLHAEDEAPGRGSGSLFALH